MNKFLLPFLAISESIKNIFGYYTNWKNLIRQIKWINIGLIVVLIYGGLCTITGYFMNSWITDTNYKSLKWLDILNNNISSFTENTSLKSHEFFYFAILWFCFKSVLISSIIIASIYFMKIRNSITILSNLSSYKSNPIEILEVAISPMPIFSYKRLKKATNIQEKTKKLSLIDIINKITGTKKFPEITDIELKNAIHEERKLIKVSNLCFKYHGDNGWDAIIHKFLKKFFPNVYRKHLINTNTLTNIDEHNNYKDSILKNINLDLTIGKFITILGCNGSSKSTFLRTTLNLLEGYSGQVTWLSKDIKNISFKSFFKNVAYVIQNNIIQNKISVYDYVAFGLFPSYSSLFKFSYSKNEPTILENLKKIGILHLKDKDINNLSGGERQKAILARSLTQETKIIVLDEPTTYLDISNQYLILNLLKKLQIEENKTIITILHDLNQARQFSDEIVLLDKGKVFAYGKTSSVLNKENIEEIFEIPCPLIFNK